LEAGAAAGVLGRDFKQHPRGRTSSDQSSPDRSFAGREYDAALLRDLPPEVDPCAERGEFHTCAYAGPMFNHPIAIETGETIERDGFVFTDVALVNAGPADPACVAR